MPNNSSELPLLVGQEGLLNGQRWVVSASLTIGRDEACDVVIVDRQVSRFHARLNLTEAGVELEDLGSKNGTYANGERLEEPRLLMDGDFIQVALVQHFVFLSSDATLPLSADELPAHPAAGHCRLTLDARSRRVWVDHREVLPPLSSPQFRLLQELHDQHGQVIARDDLIRAIWGEKEAQGVSEQAFDALVRRLRERLASLDPDHQYILTVRGHGLRYEE